MSDWYKNPDTSTLQKIEDLGEKIVWVRDIGSCYVLRTSASSESREKAFGYVNDELPMFWKLDKKTGAIEWTDYVPVMNDIRNKPNLDIKVLEQFR